MRTGLIFLSFGVIATIIHCANAAPKRVRSLELDEVRNMMKEFTKKLEAYVEDDSTGASEEDKEKITDAIELIEKSSSEESDGESSEQDDGDDKEAIFPHFINVDHEKVAQNSDEN